MTVSYPQTPKRSLAPDARVLASVAARQRRSSSGVGSFARADASRDRCARYFTRHWTGDLPLLVSCWVNALLTASFAHAVIFSYYFLADKADIPAGISFAASLVLLHLALAALWVWYFVGAWRSAARHRQRGGKAAWAGLARFVIVIAVFRVLADFAEISIPLVYENMQIALGDNRFGDNDFRLTRNGTELEFSGGINFGTAQKFSSMLDAAPQVRVVRLNSPGGRLSEANTMAAEVRKRNLITHVVEQCHSACTTIFLAGRERWISASGKLGFHEPSVPGLKGAPLRDVIRREQDKLLSMGVSSAFAARALSTPNESIWIPSHAELLEARVLTRIVDESRLATAAEPKEIRSSERLFNLLLRKTSMVRAWPETYL